MYLNMCYVSKSEMCGIIVASLAAAAANQVASKQNLNKRLFKCIFFKVVFFPYADIKQMLLFSPRLSANFDVTVAFKSPFASSFSYQNTNLVGKSQYPTFWEEEKKEFLIIFLLDKSEKEIFNWKERSTSFAVLFDFLIIIIMIIIVLQYLYFSSCGELVTVYPRAAADANAVQRNF